MFDKADWIVAGCAQSVATRFITKHHYARGNSLSSTHLHGLYPRGWVWYNQCVGVAQWIPPTRDAAAYLVGEAFCEGVLSLTRLVISPAVPKNACSFLLAHSARLIKQTDPRWHTLLTYADHWRGHMGTIYRAAGWEYKGETEPCAIYTRNGRMLHQKTGSGTRTHAQMLAMGCKYEGHFSKSRFCLRLREPTPSLKVRRVAEKVHGFFI